MKAVIYARVSSTTDRQNTERQIADLTKYAEYKGMEISKVFEEKISGAKKNSERPVFVEAISFCKTNKIDILLVSELSRLGRNAFEVLETVKQFVDEASTSICRKNSLLYWMRKASHPCLRLL